MQNILYNISQVLGITIIHSLWQGLLIYFILKVVLLVAVNLSSAKKYLLALSSLLAITLWFAYTLVNEIQVYDWLTKPQSIANLPLLLELPANLRHFNDATARYYYSIEGYLPYITALYVTGLLLNTGRLVLCRKKISHIKQTMSLAVHLQQQIGSFTKKLNIPKKVKVGFSHLVDVPCITGYLKPVILLPITLSTYLEAEEIEAILMHELAHIKRNDYVINLLQQVITTLLFFNPCVLLINKIIGQERENSCDDLVVNSTQMPVVYAKALFKLEQNRQNELQLALAVTGKKYHLLNRIERIMKTKKQTTSIRPTLVAMLVLSLSVGSLALLNPEIAEGKISVKIAKPAIDKLLTDTVPVKAAKLQAKVVKAKAIKNKARIATLNRPKNGDVYFPGIKDPELDRLSADVQKHADVIEKYYNSPDFKTQSDEMDRLGKEVDAFYNSDKIKQLTAEQEKFAAEYEKLMNGKSAGMEQYGKQMEDLGKQIDKYFNSPEFKEMNAALEKKYGITHNGNHDSRDENYRKYQDELQSKLSPQIKQQTQQMKKLGEQIRSVYASPEMHAQTERMRAMGDSLRRAFNNPAIKQQQEQMRKVGDRMRNFTNNEQIRKQQKLLNEATARLRAYMKSPEFKKKMQEYRKTARAYNYHFDNHNDLNGKPELPEVPEAPEAPEAPETDF